MYWKQFRQSESSSLKLFVLVAVFACFGATVVNAQTRGQRVQIAVLESSSLKIHVGYAGKVQDWSFRNAYAGAVGLGDRIEEFQAIGISDEPLTVRKIAAGEYRSQSAAKSISYVVRIAPPKTSDLPHLSWLAGDYGLLMIGDLLPWLSNGEPGQSIRFDLPSSWSIFSATKKEIDGSYSVDDPDSSVFFVGKDLRGRSTTVRGMELQFVVRGVWAFSDKDGLKSASRVLEKYFELTGYTLRKRATVFLAPIPNQTGSTQWKAETRGSTVSLVMNPRADIKHWVGQLGVIFTHELLHLWVPNSLSLKGSYDWYFEGFTLYAALQMALRLKLIGFQEYLDTLARVYDSYLSYQDQQSLIQASESRWTSTTPVVYDKGMLVAFIYDLTLRGGTKGKMSLSDQYRVLFDRFANDLGEGNDVIIKLLNSSAATAGFSKSYVEKADRLELESVLPRFGFELDTAGTSSRLRVRNNLTPDQKALVRSLGYQY